MIRKLFLKLVGFLRRREVKQEVHIDKINIVVVKTNGDINYPTSIIKH